MNHKSHNGKTLLLKTLQHQPTDAVPWIPFAGIHAGKLKGYNAAEVLTDPDKLFEALISVNTVYDPDGQPVLFDLQVEAEILGCDLVWAEKSPPSVASHPLATDPTPPSHLPQKTDGRLPLILDVMQRMKSAVGDDTALLGLICGPFTLASHLRGTEIFMDMMLYPDNLHRLLIYTVAVAKQMAAYYVEAGMDIIAVVDPLVSQVGPKHFEQFLSAGFADLFTSIHKNNAYGAFFVCGDATKNIELMCKTTPDLICVDENVNLVKVKTITDRYNITLGGNIPLTTVMLMGTQQDNMQFTLNLFDSIDHHNFILAPGCDMPFDVPVENVIGVVETVRDPVSARQMLAHYEAHDLFDIPVELPDYEHLTQPLIEVFTLDSDTCAACTYMWSAAQRVREEFGTGIDIVEYKFTQRENVARCKKMGVQNLPSIYINGRLKYSSIIPSHDELLRDIREVLTNA